MSYLTGSAALRCYRAHHPDARVNLVTFSGRTVWMTQKQYAIWRVVLDYKQRNRVTSLANIARKAAQYHYGQRISISTVSRFLRKLDLWRFVDVLTVTGRLGGTAIFTRHSKTSDREPWLAGARQSWASRRKARDRMMLRWRAIWDDRKSPGPAKSPVYRGKQLLMELPQPLYRVPVGSTDAKYRTSEG